MLFIRFISLNQAGLPHQQLPPEAVIMVDVILVAGTRMEAEIPTVHGTIEETMVVGTMDEITHPHLQHRKYTF